MRLGPVGFRLLDALPRHRGRRHRSNRVRHRGKRPVAVARSSVPLRRLTPVRRVAARRRDGREFPCARHAAQGAGRELWRRGLLRRRARRSPPSRKAAARSSHSTWDGGGPAE